SCLLTDLPSAAGRQTRSGGRLPLAPSAEAPMYRLRLALPALLPLLPWLLAACASAPPESPSPGHQLAMEPAPAAHPAPAAAAGVRPGLVGAPAAPARAFCAVATATSPGAEVLARMQTTAETAARRQLADRLRTTVHGCARQVLRQILSPEDQLHEEAL